MNEEQLRLDLSGGKTVKINFTEDQEKEANRNLYGSNYYHTLYESNYWNEDDWGEMPESVKEDFFPTITYKYRENLYVKELKRYVDSTYSEHYAKNNFQATEFIIDGGHGTGFCIGNVLKYAQRYGKKGTRHDARKDLLKVLHYALIQLYIHDSMKD